MEFSRYHKSDIFIEDIEDRVKYRRYLNSENQRLVDYVQGNVSRINSDDFNNVTSIDGSVLGLPMFEMMSASEFLGDAIYSGVRVIELGEKITTIGSSASDNILYMNIVDSVDQQGIRFVFPASLRTINGKLGGLGAVTPTGSSGIVIWDFSKLKSVPTLNVEEGFTITGTIQVPKSLLTSWKAAKNWSNSADKMVGV